jgi:hypothetical protein
MPLYLAGRHISIFCLDAWIEIGSPATHPAIPGARAEKARGANAGGGEEERGGGAEEARE